MFKFQNPQINNSTELEEQFEENKPKLEAGESLNEVSDVDSMHSLDDLDDEDIDLENENRIRARVPNLISISIVTFLFKHLLI